MGALEREAMLCLTQPQTVIAMLRQQRNDLHSEVERLTSIIHNWARSHESASPVYKREPENKALFDEAFGRSSATETPS